MLLQLHIHYLYIERRINGIYNHSLIVYSYFATDSPLRFVRL